MTPNKLRSVSNINGSESEKKENENTFAQRTTTCWRCVDDDSNAVHRLVFISHRVGQTHVNVCTEVTSNIQSKLCEKDAEEDDDDGDEQNRK